MKKQKNNARATIIEEVAETQRDILALVEKRFAQVEGKLDVVHELVAEMHEIITDASCSGDLESHVSLQEQIAGLGVRMTKLEKRVSRSS